MSLTALPYRLRTVRFECGEHRSYLLDGEGIPEPYSTLYCTIRIRNAQKGVSSQQAALGAINVLYAHARNHRVDVVQRVRSGRVLDAVECEALLRSVQRDYGPESKAQEKVIALGGGKRGHRYAGKTVATRHQYNRLTYIADFLKWLGAYFGPNKGPQFMADVGQMVSRVLALRGPVATQGRNESKEKPEFTRADYRCLASALTSGAANNPFTPEVQLRNQTLVDLLSLLGERKGAALNLRVGDIDWAKRQLSVIRRAGSKDDPRANQPKVKTLEHTVPVGPGLMRLLETYRDQRRNVPGARKHPYFFVVHKPGPTQGQPMSISSLNAIFSTINEVDLGIPRLNPHMLRHFNGTSLADEQQAAPATEQGRETHRRVRNTLAGRRPESDVDAVYTEKATRREAERVSIQHQQMLAESHPEREAQLAQIAAKFKTTKETR
jgi:integrase